MKCEQCGERNRYADRSHCRRCILAWQRSGIGGRPVDGRGSLTDHCNPREIIPKRYWEASIGLIPPAIRKRAETLPEDKGLLLWGPPGVGKTYTQCALFKELYNDGCDIERLTWDMLCLRVRDCYSQNKSELELLETYVRVENLLIEDLGTTVSQGKQESDFALRIFIMILDQRLEQCRATYITTNKPVEELGKSFDARIASRLQQACVIGKMTGKDRRI